MIRFLIERPIAVLMAFAAFFIIGAITYFTLPVSLLPDIAIPEITVQVKGGNASARELENTIVRPLRQQLMQLAKLNDLRSETRDGGALIRLGFDFGADTDLAFIEVNEKIDAAMNYLPRDAERPRVIKASATDIPVFCLNLTLKDDRYDKPLPTGKEMEDFLALSEFTESVIKRSIEQLPEVAMADITGSVARRVRIIPDMKKLETSGFTVGDIENAIAANNIEPGSMSIRDGYYEYNVRFSAVLRTVSDVEEIYLNRNGRLLRLKDIAEVSLVPEKEQGLSLSNGKRAVTLAIIKQADENMNNMKKALNRVMEHFAATYPTIDFSISRNQTLLLDYTIANLKQDLIVGLVFICIITFFFIGDAKSPGVIGLSLLVSLVICFTFFYIFRLSLNIISLAGLILALGMMIDSSIIVTENISRYRGMGDSVNDACDKGTTEVIVPMLSSTLTTIVVFFPLVFMSGIAGAIFYDQALAVTIGLFVSYLTGIMFLPVLYKIFKPPYAPISGDIQAGGAVKAGKAGRGGGRAKTSFVRNAIFGIYDAGVDYVFRHKIPMLLLFFISIPMCVLLFRYMPKSRMPHIEQNELVAYIDWNENLHLNENCLRVDSIFRQAGSETEHTAYVGRQQFMLNRGRDLSPSESEIYFKTPSARHVEPLRQKISAMVAARYPKAVLTFSPPETIFEKLFVTGEADLVAELSPLNKDKEPEPEAIRSLESLIRQTAGAAPEVVPFDNQLNLRIDPGKLLLYNIDYNELYRLLQTAFKDNQAGLLRSYQQYLPIVISGHDQTVSNILAATLVTPSGNRNASGIPLSAFVEVVAGEDLKTITAGKNGEYIPFRFYNAANVPRLIGGVRQAVDSHSESGVTGEWDAAFSGSFFSNRKMLAELLVIFSVSLMLMYFILASQFESFIQPLIVLLEIPMSVFGALLALWMCGHTLNLMSAIGIVVTCSVVINDSILKLDAINTLRKEGMELIDAIHEAGRRRLRPIVMTALTSIFAMAPIFLTSDIGSQLQKPLAIAMISAMIIGTAVSLFIIPLIYWGFYRKKRNVTVTKP
ncbi:MAG: efflux RND transporter permease subunit [Tannerellaceae bacterium]|jgi:multidrug efflux pump subunit AcrB|nr:efflux RND transporter permease subunit [Tannerellaceae bacterium]